MRNIMAYVNEVISRELQCGTATMEEGDEAFVVIKMPSSKMVAFVKLEKIQKNGYVVLKNLKKGEKYKVLPSGIIEINDTLRRMNVTKSFSDSEWDAINASGKVLIG